MNLRDTLGIPVDMLPMGDADLDAVTALEASVQAFPWSRGNFADSLTAGHSVWVCRIGGELIGFAVLMLVLDEAHLLNFAVCRRFQGQGLGARLLLHSLKAAAGHGAGARRDGVDLHEPGGAGRVRVGDREIGEAARRAAAAPRVPAVAAVDRDVELHGGA